MALELKDPSKLPQDFVVFYCWQDHLDKKQHRYLIRKALEGAIEMVQAELPDEIDCELRLDSDTSNTSGSVEIVNAILEKIRKSTIVVADVTPVLKDDLNGRHYPNPNVMMEVGYAARSIGWNRVVNVFNASSCAPRNLPFDIAHRRLSSYSCSSPSDIATATSKLKAVLRDAIVAIVQGIDRGEVDPSLSDEVVRRQRDLRTLKEVMSTLDSDTIEHFINGGLHASEYTEVADWYADYFYDLVDKPGFRFHDPVLHELVKQLRSQWGIVNDTTSRLFSPVIGSRRPKYKIKPHHLWKKQDEKDYLDMTAGYEHMNGTYRKLLEYVHENYTEIDERETSAIARERMLSDSEE